MTKEIKGRRIVVLPVLIDDVKLPANLKDKLYADFRNEADFDRAYNQLLSAIQQDRTLAPPNQTSLPAVTKTIAKSPSFEDIVIIGVDKQLTTQSDRAPALYNVHFELSARPPHVWEQIFTREREFPRHTMWRRAYVSGSHIVVECTLEEVQRYHLNDIKVDVKNSNTKYRTYLAEEQQKKQREEERRQAIEDEKSKHLDNLDF